VDRHQRERREEKRILKRKGTQRARRRARRELVENPDEAHIHVEPDYGRFRSADLNGLDHDSTRRRAGGS
jgi:hypothetical protein